MNIRIQNQPGELLEDHLNMTDVESKATLSKYITTLSITLDISASNGFYLQVEELVKAPPEVMCAAPYEKSAFSIYPVNGVINAITIHYPLAKSRHSPDISTPRFRVIDIYQKEKAPHDSPDYYDRLIFFYHQKLLPHEVKSLLVATE